MWTSEQRSHVLASIWTDPSGCCSETGSQGHYNNLVVVQVRVISLAALCRSRAQGTWHLGRRGQILTLQTAPKQVPALKPDPSSPALGSQGHSERRVAAVI